MKTLVIYNSIILGISEEDLKIGDVVEIELPDSPGEDNRRTLTVYQVLHRPSKVGFENHGEVTDLDVDDVLGPTTEYDKAVYLAYNEKASKKYVKKTSQKLEKRMAKSLDGRTTPGSGAFNSSKGDVRSDEWLGEHKYTDAREYRLQHRTWAKIAQEAFDINKTPVLEIVLDQTNRHLRLMFMDLHDFYLKTFAPEEQFINMFFMVEYVASKSSVLLTALDIKEHIDITMLYDPKRIPGVFVHFGKLTLLGILAQDFEKIFK